MVNLAVICVSDRSYRKEREDLSGPAIIESLSDVAQTKEYVIVPDEKEQIENELLRLCETEVTVIITTGGTGLAPRDVTPEATRAVAQKDVPGISEAIRQASLKYTPNAMLSRGISVVREHTLIINFPGSPKAVKECAEIVKPILEHAQSLLLGQVGDCAR